MLNYVAMQDTMNFSETTIATRFSETSPFTNDLANMEIGSPISWWEYGDTEFV